MEMKLGGGGNPPLGWPSFKGDPDGYRSPAYTSTFLNEAESNEISHIVSLRILTGSISHRYKYCIN